MPGMDTNERLRTQARRLIDLGVSQKILAARMGMTPSTFSKWLNAKPGISPASVVALDGLNAFIAELREEAQRADATAEGRFQGDRRRENLGPPPGEKERRKTG